MDEEKDEELVRMRQQMSGPPQAVVLPRMKPKDNPHAVAGEIRGEMGLAPPGVLGKKQAARRRVTECPECKKSAFVANRCYVCDR